jgi:hypothetical protein
MTATTASRHVSYVSDQPFFARLAQAIAIFTLVSFAQIAARGLTDPLTAPVWVHIHALLMVGWLGLFVGQNRLAASNLQLHKKLGIAGAILAAAIIAMGGFLAVKTIEVHRLGPSFSGAYFLASIGGQATLFGVLVTAALIMRRHPEYHRRLMFGATIAVCGGPALGRWLPESVGGDPRSAWIYLALDLGALILIARHDRGTRGSVHPATLWAAAVISLGYSLMVSASYNSALIALADRLASQ